MAACINVYGCCVSMHAYVCMCSLYSIHICIQLYNAKGINVVVNEKDSSLFTCIPTASSFPHSPTSSLETITRLELVTVHAMCVNLLHYFCLCPITSDLQSCQQSFGEFVTGNLYLLSY